MIRRLYYIRFLNVCCIILGANLADALADLRPEVAGKDGVKYHVAQHAGDADDRQFQDCWGGEEASALEMTLLQTYLTGGAGQGAGERQYSNSESIDDVGKLLRSADAIIPSRWLGLLVVVVCGALAMVMIYLLAWLTITSSLIAVVRLQLQLLGCFDCLFLGLSPVVLSTTALQISHKFGHGAEFSGLIVSSYFMLSAPGLLVGRSLISSLGFSARRWWMLTMVLLTGLGHITTGLVLNKALPIVAATPNSEEALLLGTLAFSGFCQSTYFVIMLASIAQACPVTHRVHWQIYQTLSVAVGSGAGALLVAMLASTSGTGEHSIIARFSSSLRTAGPFYALGAICLVHLLCAWVVFPENQSILAEAATLDDAQEDQKGQSNAGGDGAAIPTTLASDERSLWLRKVVYLLGNLYGLERLFVQASMEAATSYVLEALFGWPISSFALAIGIFYLLGAFAAYPFTFFKHWIDELLLMKIGSLLGFAASVVLAIFISQSEVVVLAVDFVLFTACFLAGGVAEGMALASAIPGTLYSIENALCFRPLIKSNVARFLAPLIVRCSITKSPHLYGVIQAVITGTSLVLCYFLAQAASELKVLSLVKPSEEPVEPTPRSASTKSKLIPSKDTS
mmetsp:Transcript_63734/g.151929  ORF Transcript_63734/g.151929 Transcript_63734/m.151929 type:complete len:625 (+) Transcript_63734:29-1903(+)